jgi:hypothetical protein
MGIVVVAIVVDRALTYSSRSLSGTNGMQDVVLQ